jgi:hypothetical protein
MEHRWGKRSTLDIGVRLHLGSGVVDTGRIANASLSGALVRTTRRLPAFTRVVVEFERGSSRQSAQRRAPAYVVRMASEGLGLEWYEFAPPAVAALLGPIAARSRNAGARTMETRALAREHPQLDLLVTGYHLNNAGTGTQVITALRESLGKPLKAVLITGDTSSALERG